MDHVEPNNPRPKPEVPVPDETPQPAQPRPPASPTPRPQDPPDIVAHRYTGEEHYYHAEWWHPAAWPQRDALAQR
jgi:hypothetical protein